MITSLQNPGVKETVRLRERRERERSDLFLIEGYREMLRAVDGGVSVKRLYICPELFLGSNEQALIDRVYAEVLECTADVFRKLSYRDRPDGLLAVAEQRHRKLEELEGSLFVIAEAIEKPGNLGTILRSSDATGVDGVIVVDRCTDIHNPNVVRASVGTLFTVPVVEAGGEETLKWLRERGIRTLAATPAAEVNYSDVDMSGPLAVVMGTEQHGLSDRWMEGADVQVRIPMLGVADSLNVAMATTVLLYEVLQKRS